MVPERFSEVQESDTGELFQILQLLREKINVIQRKIYRK
jgi:hypothetical protein